MTSFSGRMPSAGGATASGSQVQLRQSKGAAKICGLHFSYAPGGSGIVLRSPRRSSMCVVAALGPGGAWERSGDLSEREKVGPCSYAVGDNRVEDFVAEGGSDGGVGALVSDRRRASRTELAVAALMTVVMGVGNRVLYKLALVPLKHYPFFLAQLATFGYLPPSTALTCFLFRENIQLFGYNCLCSLLQSL